jgi:hypothetical protein
MPPPGKTRCLGTPRVLLLATRFPSASNEIDVAASGPAVSGSHPRVSTTTRQRAASVRAIPQFPSDIGGNQEINMAPRTEQSERELSTDINAAIAGTEDEIFRDAMEADLDDNDGDHSLEEMGDGLEGDHLDEDDIVTEETEGPTAEDGEDADGEDDEDDVDADGAAGTRMADGPIPIGRTSVLPSK